MAGPGPAPHPNFVRYFRLERRANAEEWNLILKLWAQPQHKDRREARQDSAILMGLLRRRTIHDVVWSPDQ